MPLTCPKCQGGDTQRLSVVFHTAQTALLQLAAPPKKGSYLHIFEFWFLGTMIMDLVSRMLQWPAALGSLLILAIFVASAFAFMRAFMFNKNVWPLLFEKWQQSYICLQCRNIFDNTVKSQAAPPKE